MINGTPIDGTIGKLAEQRSGTRTRESMAINQLRALRRNLLKLHRGQKSRMQRRKATQQPRIKAVDRKGRHEKEKLLRSGTIRRCGQDD